jgi:hypothetical protein
VQARKSDLATVLDTTVLTVASDATVRAADQFLLRDVERPPIDQEQMNHAVFKQVTQEPVLGLLNIPEIVGGGCGPNNPETVALYPTPAEGQSPIGLVQYLVADRQPDGLSCGTVRLVLTRTSGAIEDVPNEESGYEIKALIALQRSSTWFRVALQQGSAWIKRDTAEDFESYPALLLEKLAFLLNGWDGQLWRRPNAGKPAPVPDVWKRHLDDDVAVEVLEIQIVADQAWLHVRLQTESCNGTIPDVVPVAGWVPAYRASGAVTAWFSSRGC